MRLLGHLGIAIDDLSPGFATTPPHSYTQACLIDHTMNFHNFEAPRAEAGYAPPHSHYQFPSTFPVNTSSDRHTVEGGYFGSDYMPYHERQGSQGTGIPNAEESDTASRSRLTQEQLAHLEREFQRRYKPNTEYKRTLAESMGVDYQKVNVSNHYRQMYHISY